MKKTKSILAVLLLFTIIAIPVFFSGCSSNKTPKTRINKESQKQKKVFAIKTPTRSQIVRHKELFEISLKSRNTIPDSIQVFSNKKIVSTNRIDSLNFTATVETDFVGNQIFNLTVYFTDSLKENHNLKLFVLPNTIPINYSYKVLRSFQHDPMAYTQGLLYNKGVLYESTGRKKHSSIRKTNIKTGEIIQKRDLEPQFFGEGIALHGDKIYMITYTSQAGFIFDAESFDLIRQFGLQTKEGWGLTSSDSELILSDGSASLYFFEPEYFSLKRQIEVCDDKQLVNNINELELTKYGIFANIYGENHIILIDETTGIVKGKVDLSELFPKSIPKNYDYVLNGIAFDSEKETFYITGKQWPVIYEIKINID